MTRLHFASDGFGEGGEVERTNEQLEVAVRGRDLDLYITPEPDREAETRILAHPSFNFNWRKGPLGQRGTRGLREQRYNQGYIISMVIMYSVRTITQKARA